MDCRRDRGGGGIDVVPCVDGQSVQMHLREEGSGKREEKEGVGGLGREGEWRSRKTGCAGRAKPVKTAKGRGADARRADGFSAGPLSLLRHSPSPRVPLPPSLSSQSPDQLSELR